MSRTDAHKPLWVRNWQDGHWIHDHRTGQCREETQEHPSARSGHTHYMSRCPRLSWETVPCTQVGCYRRYVINRTRRAQGLELVEDCGYEHRKAVRNFDTECEVCDREEPTCYKNLQLSYGEGLRAVGQGPGSKGRRRQAARRLRARSRAALRTGLKLVAGGDWETDDFEDLEGNRSFPW